MIGREKSADSLIAFLQPGRPGDWAKRRVLGPRPPV